MAENCESHCETVRLERPDLVSRNSSGGKAMTMVLKAKKERV